VAFSPDGSRIVTASTKGGARVWDTVTGKELVNLRATGLEAIGITSAVFSPDGKRILVAPFGNVARVWDVHVPAMSTDELLADMCGRPLRGVSVMTRDDMRLIGEPDDTPPIDVCAGVVTTVSRP
jgi:WD40 repeat protein